MPASRKRPDSRAVKDFVEWARARAIAFDDPIDSAANASRLAPLAEALRRKRIVFLGEPDHFIHEKYSYRLLVLRYLLNAGWNLLGEEMGASDGYRVDRFLAGGDDGWLARVPIYGYKGARRTDREDKATGLLKDSYSAAFPEAAFSAEQTAFARRLREMLRYRAPNSARFHFFGFDIDGNPGAGYEDLAEILGPFRLSDSVAKILAEVARVPNETLDQEIARLDRAIASVEDASATLHDLLGDRAALVAQFTRALQDSLRYIQMAFPAADWPALNRAMAYRETVMYRRVGDTLNSAAGSDRLILMSHNLHLAKDFGSLKAKIGAGPGGGTVDPIGTHLAKAHPGEIYSVWMLCNRGRDSQPFSLCSNEIKPVAGSLNAILSELGGCFLLPLEAGNRAARLIDSALTIRMDGNTQVQGAISRQADAIFFVDEVSPLCA